MDLILIVEESEHPLFVPEFGMSRTQAETTLGKILPDSHVVWWDTDNVQKSFGNVHVLVTAKHGVDLTQFPRLRFLSLGFTGYDDLDRDYCQKKGIKAYYVPGYATHSVAELTLALAISLLRRIPIADRQLRAGRFDLTDTSLQVQVRPGVELFGKTVGVIGTGDIGIASAKLFRSCGCTVLGHSPTHYEEFSGSIGEYVEDLDSLLPTVDVLVLHRPCGHGDRPAIGARELELMEPHAIVVNAARTELIDLAALVDALENRGIAGAALDVTERELTEPQAGLVNALGEFDNVIMTPHIGFTTREALSRLAQGTIANVERAKSGSNVNAVPYPTT